MQLPSLARHALHSMSCSKCCSTIVTIRPIAMSSGITWALLWHALDMGRSTESSCCLAMIHHQLGCCDAYFNIQDPNHSPFTFSDLANGHFYANKSIEDMHVCHDKS